MIPFTRLLSLLFCGMAVASAAYADEQEELKSLRERIMAMQSELDKTSESKSGAADSLRESERVISDSNRKLAELAARQRAVDIKLGNLQAQERKLISNLSGQQALLGKLLHQQYLGGRQEYLKLLLSNQNPNQLSHHFQYYQ